jgi:hypothetical protein
MAWERPWVAGLEEVTVVQRLWRSWMVTEK